MTDTDRPREAEPFGARLKRMRLARGLKQTVLSQMCGWRGNQTMSGLERLFDPPSHATLVKLAAALKVPVESLRTETDPSTPADAPPLPASLSPAPLKEPRPMFTSDPLWQSLALYWPDLSLQKRMALLSLAAADDGENYRRGLPYESTGTDPTDG